MLSSSSLSLTPVKSIRSIRTIKALRTTRASWLHHVPSSSLGGSTDRHFSRQIYNYTKPTTLWVANSDYQYCCRCLSTSRPSLAGKAVVTGSKPPVETPKVSKYRVDCNTSKVIKRKKKAQVDHALKAVPNVVRTKPVANPRKARLEAEEKTREIMKKLREAEGSSVETGGSSLAPTISPTKRPKKKAVPTPKPTSLDPELSKAIETTSAAVLLKSESTAKEPARTSPDLTGSQPTLPSLAPQAHLQPAPQQPLADIDPIISTLAGSIATQPAPISSGWSTRSSLRSYRLPPPELIDEPKHSYHDHSSLDPLPKMAASIERRPSQAPQRIKRSVYRTILDWSVHPTVQPTDFVALPDLPRTTPSLPARAGKFVKLPAVSVAATANTTSADSGDTSDKDVTKKRYVSRRRIGFDDDDDDDLLDTKLRSRQRRPSVIRLEQNSEPRSAPPSPAPLPPLPSTADHPRQTTTQVLDAIVKHRLGQNSDAQGNPWSISGIRKQKFSLGEKEKSGLLRRPVFGHSDKPEKDEPLKETTVTTAASKPFQSSLPFVSSPPRAEQIMKAVLPDQPLLSFWRKPLVDTPQHTTKQSQDSAGEYIFSPRAVLPALTTGLRKPFELLYIDSIKHSRISQMVQECVDTAKEMGLNVVKTTPEKLNSLIGHQAHQGVVLRASYLPKAVVKSMGVVSDDNTYDLQFARGPAKKFHGSATVPANNKSIESGMASGRAVAESSSPLPPPIWIVLDEIQTIYDMGQILNAAYHFGIDGVLIKDRNTVSPLAGVSAASGGALEKRPAYAIHSIIKFIKESQANGWQVIGIKAAYGSKRMKPFYKFPSTGINRPTVLVVGSDGLELQKSVGRHCDGFIHVPTLARMTTEANTLPVSVVSGIVMSRLVADRLGTAAAAGDEKKRAFVDKSRNERAVDDDDYISPDPWVEGASPPEWEEVAFGLKPKGIRYSNNRNAGKF